MFHIYDDENSNYCFYVRCMTKIVRIEGMPWPKTGATNYHAHSWELQTKAMQSKGCDLLNGLLVLGCYQLSPEA